MIAAQLQNLLAHTAHVLRTGRAVQKVVFLSKKKMPAPHMYLEQEELFKR